MLSVLRTTTTVLLNLSSLSNREQCSFICNVIIQYTRCKVITATGEKRKELKGAHSAAAAAAAVYITYATPASQRCSSNALHLAATGGSNRPSPTSSVVVLVGRSGTAPCVRRRRRNHRNSNVFSCRRIAAATGCRPATAPGTAQRPPARTRASENEELRHVPKRTMSSGHLSASQSRSSQTGQSGDRT